MDDLISMSISDSEDSQCILETIPVSDRDKEMLFRRALEDSRDAIPQSFKIFTFLHSMCPEVARDLEMKDQSVPAVTFRLLRQRPTVLLCGPDFPVESYIVLSYCWHSPAWSLAPGLTKSDEWPIAAEMMSGLLDQRQSDNEGIWIDAVCINQDNNDEKRRAVSNMDLIYRSARLVVIILEDVELSEEDDCALESLVELIAEREQKDFALPPALIHPLLRVITTIFSARWFTRAWCSHELQLGTDSLFLISVQGKGIICLPLQTVHIIFRGTWLSFGDYKEVHQMEGDYFRKNDMLSRALNKKNKSSDGRSLMAEFSDISTLACSVIEDMISIAINIGGLRLNYIGGQKTKDEVRWTLSMISLADGDATALCGDHYLLRSRDGSHTWLNWSSDTVDSMVLAGGGRLRMPHCISAVSPQHIMIDLFWLEKPKFRSPSAKHLTAAARILKVFESRQSAFRPGWMRTGSDRDRYTQRKLAKTTLACALHCDLDWIMNQTICFDPMRRSLSSLPPEKPDIWPQICSILEDLDGDGYSELANTGPEQQDLLVKGMFAFCDLAFVEGISWWPAHSETCVVVDLGRSGKGLIYLDTDWDRQKMYRLRFAVPVALSDSSCGTMRRLWLLKEGANGESWRIEAKLKVLTLSPLEEDGKRVELLKDQRIVPSASLNLDGRLIKRSAAHTSSASHTSPVSDISSAADTTDRVLGRLIEGTVDLAVREMKGVIGNYAVQKLTGETVGRAVRELSGETVNYAVRELTGGTVNDAVRGLNGGPVNNAVRELKKLL